MKLKTLAFPIALSIITASCGGNTDSNSTQQDKPQEVEKTVVQTVDTKVSWKAYKTSDKIAVGGAFDNISVNNTQKAEDIETTLTGATFSIPVSSTNTNNPARDMKIENYFFGVMMNTDNITGTINSVSNDTASISIKMNDISNEVMVPYTKEGNTLTFKSELDLNLWKVEKSIQTLNDSCKVLHTGGDGISKLWPLVDIEISSKLN